MAVQESSTGEREMRKRVYRTKGKEHRLLVQEREEKDERREEKCSRECERKKATRENEQGDSAGKGEVGKERR